jgi:Tubulin folding cofactor D C terminal
MQTRAASIALADYLDSISEGQLISILNCMENILKLNLDNDRIVIPSLETLAGLLEESIFSRIHDNYEYHTISLLSLM